MKAIMVGVDGSPHSEVALKYAIAIAELAGAGVTGLAAVTGDYEGEPPPEERVVREVEGLEHLPPVVIEWFEQALNRCADTCAVARVPFTAQMLGGWPGRVLSDEAQACDLLVLGARGQQDSIELLGRTARDTVRSCIKPVLVTRGEYRPIGRALVGYDASPAAGHAVEWVADLAAPGGWEVVLVAGAMPQGDLASDIERAADLVRTRGIEPEVERVSGDAPTIIFEQARAHEVDLIAVGGPARGALSGFFLGEKWPDIVEQAEVPVLRWR